MVLTIVLLDNNEEFIDFLDPELISLIETQEQYKLRTCAVEYWVEDFEKAKEHFKLGNKIWVSGDANLTDCLYVINTTIERDYFKENNIVFEMEEVLVELNYAPFFTQTEIMCDEDNGFDVVDKNTCTIMLDRSALGFWFGNYFNIGIIQECLHNTLLKIAPSGTMTLIDLLRFIENETGNVFITRYEKDLNSNVIHRYLDFLNPNDSDKFWELVFDYDFSIAEEELDYDTTQDEELSSETIQNDNNSDDIVFENNQTKDITHADNLQMILVADDEILTDAEGEEIKFDANSIGITGDYNDYEITLKYYIEDSKYKLLFSVLGESYDVENEEVISFDEFEPKEIELLGELPTKIQLKLYDSEKDKTIFIYNINAVLGTIQKDILDLAYNTENIKFETDETDTYKAIAPVINNDDLTIKQQNEVIQDWIDLQVTKGDSVPMIVQRVATDNYPSIAEDNPSNYWHIPVKTNNNDGKKEYDKATANWNAPFNKVQGEIFVIDDENVGVEYNNINERKDLDNISSTPKIGPVETSDTDKYAIYNDVCMKLKEKRFPEINVEVDIANYLNNKNNSYNLFDKVYVKIPTFNEPIVATVSKTIKNAHDVGTNKVELSNYIVNTKIPQIETEITGTDDLTFKYPDKGDFKIVLKDIDGNPLNKKEVSLALLNAENESTSYTTTVYHKETNENGEISLKLSYNPGNYKMECNFGGDVTYAPSNSTFNINVSGVKLKKPTVSNGYKISTKNLKWNKYGSSPKGEYIITDLTQASKKAKKIYDQNILNLLSNQKSTANLIIAIGKDKAKDKTLIETVFLKKCPRCGSTKLFWGYKWNGKHDYGYFSGTGTYENGALTGRIICSKCGTSYNVRGKAGNKTLTVKKKTKKSSSTRLKQLKAGKLPFAQEYITIPSKIFTRNQGKVINRNATSKSVSGAVAGSVKKTAKDIVGPKTGISAVKELAKWIAKNIKDENREGFYQKPSKTLSRNKGNSFCQIDLFLHMCDACGIMDMGIGCYYVYMHKDTKKSKKKVKKKTKDKTTKHMIARVNGEWVDVTMKNPWKHYQTGFGALKKASKHVYPNLPFNRTY